MNSTNIFENLSQIFQRQEINNKLFNELKVENASKLKTTLKIYILEFLLDEKDSNAQIKKSDDIWFIRDNVDNLDLCYKYIELLFNLLKSDKLAEINIFNEIDIFINTKVGNKIFYLISILNKFFLPEMITLLFVGFALGEHKEFIRNNYLKNLEDLLILAKSKKTFIDNKMNICLLNENILELLNIYFMFLLNIKKDFKSINSLEKFLFSSVSNGMNLNIYYKILDNAGKLKYLYSNKKDSINSALYKEKASKFIDSIKEKIKTIVINDSLLDIKIEEEEDEEEEEEDEDEVSFELSDSQEKQIILFSNKNESKNELISLSHDNQDTKNIKIINIGLEKKEMEGKVIQKDIEIDNNIETNVNHKKSLINKASDIKENSIDNIVSKANEIHQSENSKENEIIGNGKEKNSLSNNIIYTENSAEKETNSNSSLISQQSKAKEELFKNIMKFVDYPNYFEFHIGEKEKNDSIDFYSGANIIYFLSQLNQKVSNLKHMLNNSILDINQFVKMSELESKIRLSSLTNLKLEILVNVLKNPNIINIKRKIIEIITFHLLYENVDYFHLKKDYKLEPANLDYLEKMINLKLLKNKNDPKILNDSKRLENIKLNIKSNNSEDLPLKDEKINLDTDKKKQLLIAKNFLDFYKSILNNPVHISSDNSNYYLLPRNMFNSEIEVNKYLYDLESILSEKDDEKEIIGLNKEKEIVNLELYKKEKLFDIKDALKILFSFNSQFNNIENQATKIIKNKKEKFLKNFKEKAEFYDYIFMIEDKNEEIQKCTDFDKDTNSQIDECVNYFEKEVLNKLYELIDNIFNDEINKEKKNIIFKVKNFFSEFLENCQIKLITKEKFPDINKLLYFLDVKIILLNKISKFFEICKGKSLTKLILEKKNFNENITKIRSNLKKLKKSIVNTYNFEKNNNAYEKWINTESVQHYKNDEITLEKVKKYIIDNIKGKLNLGMIYTHDAQFCLWAIKNGFSEYFNL